MRTRSGRKPGKQPGSAGTALSQVPVADEGIDPYPAACGNCDDGLDPEAGPADLPVVRQVFEVPEVRMRVTAHLLHAAATGRLTAYHIDEHGRSVASLTAFGILPHFTGVAAA